MGTLVFTNSACFFFFFKISLYSICITEKQKKKKKKEKEKKRHKTKSIDRGEDGKTSFIISFPNKAMFLHVCSINLLKTMWEKEKLLVMSNFSFTHSVFYKFRELSAIFVKSEIVFCKIFQFGRGYIL